MPPEGFLVLGGSYYLEHKILNKVEKIRYAFQMEITDGRKLTRSAQDAIRRKAVQAVISGQMSQTAASEIFGVSRTSVCLWVSAYNREGEAGLTSKRKGRPRGGTLSEGQESSIRKSVLGKNPGQLRLPGLLWTRDLVDELIERRFGLRLSRWTVGHSFSTAGRVH